MSAPPVAITRDNAPLGSPSPGGVFPFWIPPAMKYGKEIVEKICQYVRAGNNHRDSAMLAGVVESTFYEWKEKHSEFSEALKAAESECKARFIQVIRKAAFGDGTKPPIWTAAAWWMERKYQDEYAVKYRLEHGGNPAAPIRILTETRSKLKGMTKEQLRKLAEKA